jgi:hypothetical protein
MSLAGRSQWSGVGVVVSVALWGVIWLGMLALVREAHAGVAQQLTGIYVCAREGEIDHVSLLGPRMDGLHAPPLSSHSLLYAVLRTDAVMRLLLAVLSWLHAAECNGTNTYSKQSCCGCACLRVSLQSLRAAFT